MTTDKRRIDACLKACKGISTQNLEDNVPVLELARRYNVVLRERDALREQQEINISDPAVQQRLAAQWGYVPAGAQPAPSEQDASVRKAWARFSHELHRSPDAPYPGMADAFEKHFSQSFIDREWRAEASTWAAAWKAAKRHSAQPAPIVPDGWIQRGMAELEAIRNRQDDDTLLDDRTLIERIGKAMLAAAPEAKP